MKLIDADLLIESIQATLNMGRESFPACLFCEVIDEQPTVFDTDRIVEQLKENACMVATSKEFYSNPQKRRTCRRSDKIRRGNQNRGRRWSRMKRLIHWIFKSRRNNADIAV